MDDEFEWDENDMPVEQEDDPEVGDYLVGGAWDSTCADGESILGPGWDMENMCWRDE